MLPDNCSQSFQTIYDHFVDGQIRRAQNVFASQFPKFAGQCEITDTEMLEQLACVERILHAASQAFSIKSSTDDVLLHLKYRSDVPRQSSTVTHIATAFAYLNALSQHPAYQMLSIVQAVVSRTRSLGALRDIRWMYKKEHSGLVFADEKTLFKELTAGLYQLVAPHKNAASAITQQAIQDFTGYLYDDEGTLMINEINFGTACVLAQSAVESARQPYKQNHGQTRN